METFSRVQIVGRFTADPIRRSHGPRGTLTEFSVAVNDREQRGGQWVERPMYIDCEAFGDTAGYVFADIRRGYLVLVEGKLKLERWTDAEQKTHQRHKVTVFGVQILSRPPAKKPSQISDSPSDVNATPDSDPEPV